MTAPLAFVALFALIGAAMLGSYIGERLARRWRVK